MKIKIVRKRLFGGDEVYDSYHYFGLFGLLMFGKMWKLDKHNMTHRQMIDYVELYIITDNVTITSKVDRKSYDRNK